MNETGNILYSFVADLIKLFFIIAIVMLILQYIILNIVVYRVVEQSEKDGYISNELYEELIENIVTFDKNAIEILEVEPEWEIDEDGNIEPKKVKKLGDELRFKISYKYEFEYFGKKIEFPMTIMKQGINQGYYGKGY